MKDKILKEFERQFCPIEELKPNQDKWAINIEVFMAFKGFLSKALAQTREETIEECIGLFDKIEKWSYRI